MKHTVKWISALLAAAAMLLSLTACGGTGNVAKDPDAFLQLLYNKLTADRQYQAFKASFDNTDIEEQLDGDSILISMKSEDGLNGDYVFTLDGDYIVGTDEQGSYVAYSFLTFLKNAVLDYYRVNSTLANGYLAGLDASGMENRYFSSETADGVTTYRLYVASAWEFDGIDEMYVNEEAVRYHLPLGSDTTDCYINAGKISVASSGTVDHFTLTVGEYGKNTELTLKSAKTVANKLQPKGYEAFDAAYTELKEETGDGWTVSFGIPKEIEEEYEFPQNKGYHYITVVFGEP